MDIENILNVFIFVKFVLLIKRGDLDFVEYLIDCWILVLKVYLIFVSSGIKFLYFCLF